MSVDENGGNGQLFVSPTTKPDGTYYYEYMSSIQFAALVNDATQADYDFYGVNSFNIYDYGNGNKIQKLTGVPINTYKNAQNAYITTTTVYAISKYLGPWNETFYDMSSPILVQGDEFCSQTFAWALGLINVPAGTMALSCNGASSGSSDGPPPPVGTQTQADIFDDCLNETQDYFDDDAGEEGDPQDLFNWFYTGAEVLFDCIEGTVLPDYWTEEVAVITLVPFVNTDGIDGVIELTKENLFGPNGEFIGPTLNFVKGLYYMTIQFQDGSFSSIYFEARENFTSGYAQSNFLTATVFPVPIVDDEFSLRLEATAKLKFEYVLYDLNGVELSRKNFVIQNGHNKVHTIKVPEGIPSGHLVNKFIFEDGSELIFQTIK